MIIHISFIHYRLRRIIYITFSFPRSNYSAKNNTIKSILRAHFVVWDLQHKTENKIQLFITTIIVLLFYGYLTKSDTKEKRIKVQLYSFQKYVFLVISLFLSFNIVKNIGPKCLQVNINNNKQKLYFQDKLFIEWNKGFFLPTKYVLYKIKNIKKNMCFFV